MSHAVLVTDAAGARAADDAAIQAGIPSRALMQRAGAAVATEICRRFADHLSHGVVIATGAGNNGGDGWVVAHALHVAGIRVRVVECIDARTVDALAERQTAIDAGVRIERGSDALLTGGEHIVVDALLGTGFLAGDGYRDDITASAVARLRELGERGESIVALDIPSGVDASSGKHVGAPHCALTIAFGTLKRAHLTLRDICGTVVLVDIGLGRHQSAAGTLQLATPGWFDATLPPIHANSHKGTRKKVVIVGGAEGMAGASVLAAQAALRSGAGMVKCVVSPKSLQAVQEGQPACVAAVWPTDESGFRETIFDWADAVLIGPGLGRAGTRELVERILAGFNGPVVLDADAISMFEREAETLAPYAESRQLLITPHPLEFARISGMELGAVTDRCFDVPAELAHRTKSTVLLKGVPTVIADREGRSMTIAEGTPVLATGGSGDVLGGIAVTMLAQTGNALEAGALAAFAHGRAARLVSERQVRGFTLADVVERLPDAWAAHSANARPPVLAELGAVGEA